jgi:hypothetical protein
LSITSERRIINIDPVDQNQRQNWDIGKQELTSAAIEDLLVLGLTDKEEILTADILRKLSVDKSDGRRVYISKYRAEFLKTAYLIDISNYTYFPPFRIDPWDLDPRVLDEILAVDEDTRNMIMINVIERILRSSNRLMYLEHIHPHRHRLSWKWEKFDFGDYEDIKLKAAVNG